MDIPSTHVETTRQRYITLCNQLGKINLLGMSYSLLAILNVVDLLKYWHMKYDADSSGLILPDRELKRTHTHTASYRCHSTSSSAV